MNVYTIHGWMWRLRGIAGCTAPLLPISLLSSDLSFLLHRTFPVHSILWRPIAKLQHWSCLLSSSLLRCPVYEAQRHLRIGTILFQLSTIGR
jgi:hypothetical protein